MDVLKTLVRDGRPAAIGARTRRALDSLVARSRLVGEVRGMGAMLAIELVTDRATKEPASAETQQIIAEARTRGLLLLSAGTYGNVLRFLMPLTISDAVLDEGLTILAEAVAAVEGQAPASSA